MIQINLTFCGPVILMIWMECTQRNRLGSRTSENNTTTKNIVGPFQVNLALFKFTQRGILILTSTGTISAQTEKMQLQNIETSRLHNKIDMQ